MSKHTLAYTVICRAYLDGMAEGVGRGALGYAEDMAGEYAAANAEPLIDAAPDLLAALEHMLGACDPTVDRADDEHFDYAEAYVACDAARAAIAKARGE